jgi:hypothetical protein
MIIFIVLADTVIQLTDILTCKNQVIKSIKFFKTSDKMAIVTGCPGKVEFIAIDIP